MTTQESSCLFKQSLHISIIHYKPCMFDNDNNNDDDNDGFDDDDAAL